MVEDLTVSSPPTDDDAVVAAAAADGGGGVVVPEPSALRDNISRKGKNAYYYAHANSATGPEWDGKIEPRLLGTFPSDLSSWSAADSAGVVGSFGVSSSSGSKAALMTKSNITNYAFLNEDARVKVYVELPGVGNCRDEDILLDYTDLSLCFTVKNYSPPPTTTKAAEVPDELVVDALAAAPQDAEEGGEGGVGKGEDRCLSFGRLYAEIEKATYRKKADRVIITLKKKELKTWSKVVA